MILAKPLSSRERLTRLFSGQEIDRIPIWLLAPYHRLGCYADIYNLRCYEPVVEYIDRFCDTFDRRNFSSGFCYNANPDIQTETFAEEDGENQRETTVIRFEDQSWQKSISRGRGGTVIEPLLKRPEQLEEILSIPWQPPRPELAQYFREKEELGDRGLMMADIGDPLLPLYHLTSAENFSLWTATDYDRLLRFLDVMYERVYGFYQYLLESGAGEVFFIVGAEFAGPPLVSPHKFNELSVQYLKGIVDLIRSYGRISIVHYHGNLKQILPGIKEVRPDGLHTVEAPPIGDCTLAEAREALGPDMVLIGNIQYDDLTRLEPDNIQEQARKAIQEAGTNGRFILSPTAGPYEECISSKTASNYRALIEAGLQYGSHA